MLKDIEAVLGSDFQNVSPPSLHTCFDTMRIIKGVQFSFAKSLDIRAFVNTF